MLIHVTPRILVPSRVDVHVIDVVSPELGIYKDDQSLRVGKPFPNKAVHVVHAGVAKLPEVGLLFEVDEVPDEFHLVTRWRIGGERGALVHSTRFVVVDREKSVLSDQMAFAHKPGPNGVSIRYDCKPLMDIVQRPEDPHFAMYRDQLGSGGVLVRRYQSAFLESIDESHLRQRMKQLRFRLPIDGEQIQARKIRFAAPGRSLKEVKTFGNRTDLYEVYTRAKDLVFEHELTYVKQLVVGDDGSVTLTICNLWRLEKTSDGTIFGYEFDLVSKQWSRSESFDLWPDIPFAPASYTRGTGFILSLVNAGLWKALYAAGYGLLVEPMFPEEKNEIPVGLPMSRLKMARLFVQRFTGERGKINKEGLRAGAKGITAALYEHFVDKEILSAMMAMNYRRVDTRAYLSVVMLYRDSFKRIAKEHRNLLPVLAVIHPAQWKRLNLFSREVWVRGQRRSTILDRKPMRADRTLFLQPWITPQLSSFPGKVVWRWLQSIPITVVAAWVECGCSASLATNLAIATSQLRGVPPAFIQAGLIQRSARFAHGRGLMDRRGREVPAEIMQQLYRLYLGHAYDVWKAQGLRALKDQFMARNNFGQVLDYILAEGLAAGIPARNATWPSLEARSGEWHDRNEFNPYTDDPSSRNNHYTWESALPAGTHREYAFEPLDSSEKLATESRSQGHCVWSYDNACDAGHYRVFSVVAPDGSRSTLGIALVGKGKWSVDQHHGPRNSPVSEDTARIGKWIATEYRKAEHAKAQAAREDADDPEG